MIRLLSPSTRRVSLSLTRGSFRSYASVSPNLPQAYLERESAHWPKVAILYLNRPETKNAISRQLLKEFHECLGQLDKRYSSLSPLATRSKDTRNRVLIISGSKPGAFCAGADLAERRTMSTSEVNQFLVDLRSAIHTLENMDVPTIAAIDGPALGGGLELALACDLRVAGRQATKIGLPETKLGIIPGAGGTQRLTRLLGVSKAKELVFTGRALSPEQALSYGVVDYITDSGLSKALELAEEMSSGAPLALRAAKLAISRAAELPLEAGLDFERACYQPLLSTKDRLEALSAFQMKRKPNFTGE
ncbi:hypothetical protein FRC14_004508 [Serendipita sp. 396]|nr:hypothetical protein FRC14_004508 [Serendipita sp. 396]KAG8788063.1 hypothetical protein FRC15_006382 [Serendipita sp. 397]KAG8859200.1 hypothetical protein FRB91_008695 [Serendipita sp. 411]